MRLPVPPAGAEHARFYDEVVEALRQLAVPQGPQPLWATTSTYLGSLSVTDHINMAAFCTDLGVIAVSNGTAWIRQDTGAAI